MGRVPLAPRVAAAAVTVGLMASSWGSSQAGALSSMGSITGRAVYATGEAFAGVAVSVRAETSGLAREVITDKGTYQFDDLPDGIYRIDVDLANFDLIRRNRVRVSSGATTVADLTLQISTMCECIEPDPDLLALAQIAGQVVDERGRPLPHARLEIGGPAGPEVAYADRQGRFRVRVHASQAWPLTARDSGFGPVTQQVSGKSGSPVVFRLPNIDGAALPDIERFSRGCRCASNLFTHPGR